MVMLVLWLLNYLSAVLLPFFVAWALAYLVYPIVNFLETKAHVRFRVLSILMTMTLLLVAIAIVFWLIVPPMIEQFSRMGTIVTKFVNQTTGTNDVIALIQQFVAENRDKIENFLYSKDFTDAMKSAMPKVFSLVGETASLLISIAASVITLLYMFFILLDYEKLTSGVVRIFPKKQRHFWAGLFSDMADQLSNYIRGQGTVALCMGIMFCIGFTIMDFPLGIGLGILIGLMDMVPYLHTFALIPAAFLALLKAADTGQNFWVIMAMVVGLFILVQVISDMIVTPRVMSKAMGLNPAVLLLSLSVWGALLGFIGLIIALPLTTLIIAYWKRYVTKDEVSGDVGAK